MKSIYLLRHAKSDWYADYGSDHERPLNKRGQRAAQRMGRFLARIKQEPELVLTSSAVRARTTIELASAAGGWTCPTEVSGDLYDTSPERVLGLIRLQPDSVGRLLLAGHQPAWSEVAAGLIGGGFVKMPTGAVARIDFGAESWAEVSFGEGILAWVVTPKLLGKIGFDD